MNLSRLLRGTVLSLAASLAAGQLLTTNTKVRGLHKRSHVTRQLDSPTQAHNLSVPIDHFHNESIYEPHSDGSFDLRYWFDAQHYLQGGPVIVLASGETGGEDRLPFLEYGILSMLAEATHGVAVVLEHRYYGKSFPVPDLSAKNMRFLSTEQALADTAYFVQHVEFPGLEDANLTAPNVPYIIYGGSYAGAFAAFARKLYPDLFWGAIGSSAVTEAIVDYWEYYEAARLFAPGDCATVTQKLTHVVDTILEEGTKEEKKLLKDVFGLGELLDDDFAAVLSQGISGLQSTNWDPEEDDSDFAFYCSSVSSKEILYASTRQLIPAAEQLLYAGGYQKEAKSLTNRLLNYIGYIRTHLREDLGGSCEGKSVQQCYSARGTGNNTSLDQGMMRSWVYQTCTQWGYWQTGSGVPKDQLPLISRLINVEYSTIYCREAFNISKPPNVESINRLGGLEFSFPRVAFVDGAADPWRAATPHRIGLPARASTTSEPYLLIDHGVHHWDENGVRPNATTINLPPQSVVQAQQAQIKFVKAWLKQWEKRDSYGSGDL